MPQIIPAIIAKDFNELKRKTKIIEPYFNLAQLDVMDGRFVPNETFRDSRKIKTMKTKVNWEIHLMAREPEREIYSWSLLKPKRFIFHFEACLADSLFRINSRENQTSMLENKIKSLIQKIKNYGMEAGIAINLETSADVLRPYLVDLDLALLMAVNPGFGGQKFQETVLDKVRDLRGWWPDGKIALDGGIKIDLAESCLAAGADYLAVGSALFEAENFESAVKDFQEKIKALEDK